jgi:hypothetical protein
MPRSIDNSGVGSISYAAHGGWHALQEALGLS